MDDTTLFVVDSSGDVIEPMMILMVYIADCLFKFRKVKLMAFVLVHSVMMSLRQATQILAVLD